MDSADSAQRGESQGGPRGLAMGLDRSELSLIVATLARRLLEESAAAALSVTLTASGLSLGLIVATPGEPGPVRRVELFASAASVARLSAAVR